MVEVSPGIDALAPRRRFTACPVGGVRSAGRLARCRDDAEPALGKKTQALDATAATDDKSITVPTASWWYTGVTPAFISDRLTALGARLTNLEVDPSDPSKFTVTMVKNSGAYAVSGWWWYDGLTAVELSERITTLAARPIDLQKYDIAAGVRFAVVLVSNTGAQARSFWYFHDVTASFLSDQLTAHGARLTSLKTRTVSGQTLHTAIMIANAGGDAIGWWWYLNVTPSFVAQKLGDNGARLIDYERRSNGNLDVVMVQHEGAYSFWFYGLTSPQEVSADLGRLYEGGADGSLLSGAPRTDFYNILLGGPISSSGALADVIREEAAALGKSSTVASQFIAQTQTRSKGGSYDICGSLGCSFSYTYTRSAAGRIMLPFIDHGVVISTEYVYGRFASDGYIPCPPKGPTESVATAEARCPAYKAANDALDASASEMFRFEIRKALMTW